MRFRVDGDTLLSQALIWLMMVSYLMLVYVIVVAITSFPYEYGDFDYSPSWWQNLIALIPIALTFIPVYRWLRIRVRELVYGQHETPFPALASISRHFETTPYPQAILPAVAEIIAHSLKLPYLEIESRVTIVGHDHSPITTYGSRPQGTSLEHIPITYHDKHIGELRVAARGWNEPLSHSDLVMLRDLARQLGSALQAAQLTAELQEARERLVIAREEERRRIRNDLHDGLAPTLSSMQLQLAAVRKFLHTDTGKAEVMIAGLAEDLRETTIEIRQLVYDLRPPMLDELGLAGAIKNFKYPASEVDVQVHAPEPMPELSAALEVAVYRVASEAIHNVVKHARANLCIVDIEYTGSQLILRVSDDGTSLPNGYHAGVGSASMQERTAELGGNLSIQTCDDGGTCVVASFPLTPGVSAE